MMTDCSTHADPHHWSSCRQNCCV